jgi:hypothetical protein
MPEFRTLTVLVPRVAASTLLVLVAGTFVTNNDVIGTFNKAMYLAIIVLAVIITVAFLRTDRPVRIDLLLAVLATGGLVWGIDTIERPSTIGYWEGFGNVVALGAVLLVLMVALVIRSDHFSRPVRIALAAVVSICCLSDVLGAIRTADYMPFVGNNLNQVNDMLAPIVGKAPDSTFIPEYTALYGWLFVPFKHVLSPLELVGAIAIFLTAVSIATLLLAVWVVGRLFNTRGRFFLGLALVVPITLVTSRLVGDTSSIVSFSQELPIRLFAGFLIAAIGLKDLVLLYRGSVRPRHLLLVGGLCGILAWNSQDFGVVATGVFGVMILVGATASVRVRAFAMWLLGVTVAVAAYPLFLLAIGSPLDVGYVGTFVRSAGSLGPAAIQVPGPVLIVAPIIICSAATGWALMRIRRRDGFRADALLDHATITLTFVGSWSSVCLIYYVNRAYAAGQLQTLLLPCGVCVGVLLALAMRTDEFTSLWHQKRDAMPWTRWADKVRLLPVGVFVGVCFAATWLTTNPVVAAQSLVTHPAGDSYTGYDVPQLIMAVDAARHFTNGKGGELNYLGESFNYVSLVTHVASDTLLYGFPFSRNYSAAQAQIAQVECRYLQTHRSTWIVLSLNAVAGFGHSACGLYHTVDAPGLSGGQLQELNG